VELFFLSKKSSAALSKKGKCRPFAFCLLLFAFCLLISGSLPFDRWLSAFSYF
jgi:hypothetical protein